MDLFSIAHGKPACFAHFGAHSVDLAGLDTWLAGSSPHGHRRSLIAFAAVGIAGCTLADYLLRRCRVTGELRARVFGTIGRATRPACCT